MNEWPQCTYPGRCIFRKGRDCVILTDMPKKRKDGNCPFRKEHPNDIGGKEIKHGLSSKSNEDQ